MGWLNFSKASHPWEADEAEEALLLEDPNRTDVPDWAPPVALELKSTIATGEEHEVELYTQRAKLFRYADGRWKERAVGDARLLEHKQSGMVRFVMRQEKTFKVAVNHYVVEQAPYCCLRPLPGCDLLWVWSAHVSDQSVETLALKFDTKEIAETFREAFDKVISARLHRKSAASQKGAVEPIVSSHTDDAEVEEHVEDPEVTVIPGWTPSLTLQVHTQSNTGEEDETPRYQQRAKLYRFRDGEWKERGVGLARLLQHRDTGNVRFIMRCAVTQKLLANQSVKDVPPHCSLRNNPGNQKVRLWLCQNYDDEGDVSEEMIALLFRSAGLADAFELAFNASKALSSAAGDVECAGAVSKHIVGAKRPRPDEMSSALPSKTLGSVGSSSASDTNSTIGTSSSECDGHIRQAIAQLSAAHKRAQVKKAKLSAEPYS